MMVSQTIPKTYSLCQMLTDSFSVNDEKELYASNGDFAITTDHLCRQYIWRAFEELGWTPSDHVLVTPEDILNTLDIQNNYQRLTHRLLEIIGQWKEGRWLLHNPQERLNIQVAMSDAK